MSKFKCYVSKDVNNKDAINEKVCRNLAKTAENKGQAYCILHLPNKNKDKDKFNEIIDERVDEVEKKIAEVKKLPKEKQESKLSELLYDFRSIWFPSEVTFKNKTFEVRVDFTKAVFSSYADFGLVNFKGKTYFIESTFTETTSFGGVVFEKHTNFSDANFDKIVNFGNTIFKREIYFTGSTFTHYTNFKEALFLNYSDFSKVTFTRLVEFEKAQFIKKVSFSESVFTKNTLFYETTFLDEVYFEEVEFREHSKTKFRGTNFYDLVDFQDSTVAGYLSFDGNNNCQVFLNENSVRKEKEYTQVELGTKNITLNFDQKEDQTAVLNFQGVECESNGKINFHTTRLLPNWFINTDSRKFTFIDVRLENYKGTKQDINNEIHNLTNRNISNSHKLLTITCRQLAENAESNRSYEDASDFRKMAFEVERFGRKEKQKQWYQRLFSIWQDKIYPKQLFIQISLKGKQNLRLFKETPISFLHFFYYWLSGYGEKWFRAFCWLIFIWVSFAIYYTIFGTFSGISEIGNTEPKALDFISSLGYSLQVMTLQKPEPKPIALTRIFYGFETAFTAIQTALLVLAIRKKFMR